MESRQEVVLATGAVAGGCGGLSLGRDPESIEDPEEDLHMRALNPLVGVRQVPGWAGTDRFWNEGIHVKKEPV